MKWTGFLAAALMAMTGLVGGAAARDQIRVASSSTVYPFAAAVAERFGPVAGFRTPVLESIGSGGGFKLFCAGLGEDTPDIVGASRRIARSEHDRCTAAGVSAITEIVVGYDGIVVAMARQGHHFDLTRRELFLALAKRVPVDGRLTDNPYRRWSDIDPRLPVERILIYGPAPNHGTRDKLVELVMDTACAAFPEMAAMDEAVRRQACETIREDGAFVEVSESYVVALRRLAAEPRAVGILPYGYLDQNRDKIQDAAIDGEHPTAEAIFSGRYPLSRPLYLYVKTAHLRLVPGLAAYLTAFTAEAAWGRDGYLADLGLIPLPDERRRTEAAKIRDWPAMPRP